MELPYPLHFGACQHLEAPSFFSMLIESSHMLAVSLTLAPVRRDASRPEFTSRFTQQPNGLRLRCQRAS
jgi:hypothetical protein